MDGLRITDSNSANDSRGRAFGLEGNDFIYVLVALVVALGLYLLLTVLLRFGKLGSLAFVLPFFIAPLGWGGSFRTTSRRAMLRTGLTRVQRGGLVLRRSGATPFYPQVRS